MLSASVPLRRWLLASLVLSGPAWAHNGGLALAMPVAGIALDGDLADWPASARRYPIALTGYGMRPRNEADYRGDFRIGYNTAENALYLAVEVRDESAVIDSVVPSSWDTQDGCEVYLDLAHADDSPAIQYVVFGEYRGSFGAPAPGECAVQRGEGGHRYEWRIALGKAPALRAGMALGLDVVVGDRDADGSFSWMAWGRGINKRDPAERRGDVLLIEEEARTGAIAGRVEGGGSPARPRGAVRIESAQWRIEVTPDPEGRYQARVPAGPCRVAWRERGAQGEAVEIEVAAGDSARVDLQALRHPPGRSARAGSGRSAEIGAGVRRGAWKNYGAADGLPGAFIRAIARDHQGNLWFGVHQGGVCRFDGRHLRVFGQADGLAHHSVQAILEDRQGNLWFGTGWLGEPGGGVSRYDGENFTHFSEEDGLAHHSVLCLLEDRQGHLWFGTWEGLSRWDGERFTTYTVEDGLADNTVGGICQDQQGNLWFATGYGRSGGLAGGLSRYDGERFTTYTVEDGLPGNWVTSVVESRSGALWIGTLGRGVSRYDGQRFANFSERDGLAGDRVWAIAEDRSGNLWFGTGRGVSRYDGERWTSPGREEEAGSGEVYALYVDREGLLWLGSGGGLGRYDGEYLENFTAAEGLVSSAVSSMLEDRQGNLWFATARGVSRCDGKGWTSFTRAEGLVSSAVSSMLEDRQGNLWFATARGVSRYDGKGFINYTAANGLVQDHIDSMLEDRQGHLWFGTWGGVSRYDGKGWTSFTAAHGLAGQRVVALLEDRSGNLWFGTDRGVSRYDGKRWSSFTAAHGLAGSSVQGILEDRSGNLWFGTDRGVSRYDLSAGAQAGGERFTAHTARDGLPEGWMRPVLQGREGEIWFTGSQGVVRYGGERFTAYTARDGLGYGEARALLQDREGHLWFGMAGGGVSRFDGQVFQELTRRDGLVNDTVTDLLQDRRGNVWISTLGGATRYRPHRVSPRVRITEVVADRRYGPVARIEFPSSQGHLAFAFRSADFATRPEVVVYRYRLAGYEKDWRTARAEGAEYSALPVGEYTFEVVAVDRDLNYSAEPAAVQVRVHLPYERIGWGLALGLALGLAAWQAGRLVQRDQRLREANEGLRAEIARRQQLEAERDRLDEHLRHLRYLERLRAALEGVRPPDEVMRRAGGVLMEVLGDSAAGGVRLECDGRAWTFGAQDAPQHYARPLAWGERERGRLHLFCGVALSEAQERALLDQTAGQLARALEAQELLAQLLKSARLVSLGELAAGVAHELNQPLAAISAVAGDVHLRLLEGRAVSEVQLKEMMRDITGLVERMAGTIHHLRIFSRDTGEEPGSVFSVNEVVRSGLKVLGAQLENHRITATLELGEGMPAVFGHPYHLEQVLLNLLANARDALDEKGGAQKRLWVRTHSRGGQVVMEVEDNGTGMDPETARRVFEPFFTTKPADRGTGLGLSISYAIVRNHGGRLSCQSRKGEGTILQVVLPAAEKV
jgi:ligand-binding sensor domain-containing protein/signal transduction histidine kinase